MVVVVCPRCGYRWNYRGRRMRVTCPSCGYTFRIERDGSSAPGGVEHSSGSASTVPASKIDAMVLGDYECFLGVLREHGVAVREGEAGADSVEIPASVAESVWRELRRRCSVG